METTITEREAPSPAQAETLRLVEGRTMRDALLRARSELGDKAVVVDQRAGGGKVTLAVSLSVPRSTEELRRLREGAAVLLAPLAPEPTAPAAVAPRPLARTPLADVERRLREHGTTRKARERVLEAIVQREGEDAHPLDLAADEVGRLFQVASLPATAGETAIVALLGQTGVGKTTTLAKLAMRLARAGRRVVLATLDADRVGVAAQIRAYGEMLRVPAIAIRDVSRLASELARTPGRVDVILVDGTGDEAADVETLRELQERCVQSGARTRLAPLVVLPATASAASLDATTEAAAPLAPIGAVITKIDEAAQPMPALEHASSHGLGVAFLTDGPELGPHFHRASAERFADVALLGRITPRGRKALRGRKA